MRSFIDRAEAIYQLSQRFGSICGTCGRPLRWRAWGAEHYDEWAEHEVNPAKGLTWEQAKPIREAYVRKMRGRDDEVEQFDAEERHAKAREF